MTTPTKEQLTERAQIVRIHEANCKIEYPTADELNFRMAIMKQLGVSLGLKEVRSMTIDGPSTTGIQRPQRAGRA